MTNSEYQAQRDEICVSNLCGLFGFCSCGNPEKLIPPLRDYLRNCNGDKDEKSCLDEHDEWVWVAYICDRYGLTEHGTSILHSWLTEKGKEWLNTLEHYGGNDDND